MVIFSDGPKHKTWTLKKEINITRCPSVNWGFRKRGCGVSLHGAPLRLVSTLAKHSQKTSLAPGAQRALPSLLCDTLEVFPPTCAGCPLSSASEGLVVIVTSLQPPVLSLSTKGQETPVQVQGAATLWNFIDKESGAWFIMK